MVHLPARPRVERTVVAIDGTFTSQVPGRILQATGSAADPRIS